MPEPDARIRAQPGHGVFATLLASVLTAAALYLVFRRIDSGQLWAALARQDPRWLVAAAALIVLQILSGGARWRALLTALDDTTAVSLRGACAAFYSAAFLNNFALGTIGGDIARIWLARRFERPLGQIILSVVLDNVVGLIGVVFMALLTLPAISHPWAMASWLACLGLLSLFLVVLCCLRPIERAFGREPKPRAAAFVLRLAKTIRSLTTNRMAAVAVLYAMLSALCVGLSAYFVALSLGIELSATAAMAVMAMVLLATALPISIAGWGIREASLVTMLGLLGTSNEPALLLSLEFGLLTMLASLPGGALWLLVRDETAAERGRASSVLS